MPIDSRLDFQEIDVNKNIVARSYWRTRMAGFELIPYFGFLDAKASKDAGYRTLDSKIPGPIAKQIETIAVSAKAKHILLLAALAVLVNKYATAADIVIFTPEYSDNHIEGADRNILPVRVKDVFNRSFRDLLLSVKDDLIQDMNHADYPVEKKIGYESQVIKEVPSIGIVLQDIQLVQALDVLNFDLLFSFNIADQFSLHIQYNAARFSEEQVSRIAQFYGRILQIVTADPLVNVGSIDLVDESERHQLLHAFNNTQVACSKDKTIIDLFEEQVLKTPHHIAVASEDTKLTYQQLNAAANKLAHYLRNKWKVKPDDLVGVLLGRSEKLVISILAILKAGAAYLPVDPAYPDTRIQIMVENSALKGIITEEEHAGKTACENLIVYSNEAAAIDREPSGNPQKVTGPEDLFYVIYTSGSTGIPKGVMVKQHAVTNLVHWYGKLLSLSEQDCVLLMAPIGFDLTQKNFFVPLLNGARLYLSERLTLNYPLIADVIQEYQITVVNVAPSAFYPLLDKDMNDDYRKLSSLRKVVLGGEPINIKRMGEWSVSSHYHAEVINSYGPTECTDVVSYYVVNNADWGILESIPIGRPVDNTQLYILNAGHQLVPVGISGEIWIGGVGVSRGYLNNDQLTARKFIKDPFHEGGFMYSTGDWGKWLPDGNIDFAGRIDNQVKIRGSRIELGEIEHRLNQHKAIRGNVVVAKEKGTDKYLVGYYVSEEILDPALLRSFLQEELPDYMVPAFFVHLQQLPLTPNGKLDRRSLPDPDFAGLQQYIAPSNEIEEKLVELWADVLEIDKEKISVNVNFFDVGGDSLSILKLNSKINTHFQCDIPVADMFTLPTITAIQKFIKTGEQRIDPLDIALQEEDREFILSNREN